MIKIYGDSTTKKTKKGIKFNSDYQNDVLPGSFEFPDEGVKYDWKPDSKKKADRSVSETTKTPIAIF